MSHETPKAMYSTRGRSNHRRRQPVHGVRSYQPRRTAKGTRYVSHAQRAGCNQMGKYPLANHRTSRLRAEDEERRECLEAWVCAISMILIALLLEYIIGWVAQAVM